MKFQRAHSSIIKSIRQISLMRDWVRLRRDRPLPVMQDYTPDERAGDAADVLIADVQRIGAGLRYHCSQAGSRIVQANDAPMQSRFLDECLDRAMVLAAQPVWNACIENKLPIYSIVPSADRNGCPVTLEHLYLPFGSGNGRADFILGSLLAFSAEGRFQLQGLLRRNTSSVPLQWAVIVDPELTIARDTQGGSQMTGAAADDKVA